MKKKVKNTKSITFYIFAGLLLGAITGIIFHYFVPAGDIRDKYLIDGVFYLIGQAFMRLLQMLVVPLVFFSLSTGALAMGDTASLGRVGVKTLLMYLMTTALAIALALLIAKVINPGVGMDLTSSGEATGEIADAPPITETLLNIIPTNPFDALAKGEMLQVIVFALLVGVIVAQMPEKLSTISNILEEGNGLMMKMTSMVMKFAPYGIFALIARTFSQLGFETFLPMLSYMGSVTLALIMQVCVVYLPMLLIFARLSPIPFFRKIVPVVTFGFSSASSGATIPVTLKQTDEMGIPRKISAFTIPLGATVNMDGTAIMQGVAVIFVANAYGIELTMADFMTVIFTATLASVGTAGVPGVGLITLSMVLTSVGLPVEGIAMIMGIDRILDMARTAVNIVGDVVVTLICAKTEKQLDENQYYSNQLIEENEEF